MQRTPAHPKSTRTTLGRLSSIVASFSVCAGLACADPNSSQPEGAFPPKITVSASTTHIVTPLDADGFVDYFSALNEIASRAVTPQNNAGVLFARAFGMKELAGQERLRFGKLLGIDPLPENGESLEDFKEFTSRRLGRPPTPRELADFESCQATPWSRTDQPLISAWLAANEKPLALVVAGTARSKCYLPVVAPPQTPLTDAMLYVIGPQRATQSLLCRAMARIEEGNTGEAKNDLLACHRLGRLIGTSPFAVGALTGLVVNILAYRADVRFMERGQFSAAQALTFERELADLPPLPSIADRIDAAERFKLLDAVRRLAQGKSTLTSLGADSLTSVGREVVDRLMADRARIDWDGTLRFCNEEFDKAVRAARRPTPQERKRACESVLNDLKTLQKEVALALLSQKFGQGRQTSKELGHFVGQIVVASLMPGYGELCDREDICRERESLAQVGLALCAFNADRGAFPVDLSELAPKYISRVPNDRFSEQPLHYRPEKEGFLLYSVGSNARDDGGATFDSTPPADDVVLRVSCKPRRPK